jgi:putative ABC transport system permease protein
MSTYELLRIAVRAVLRHRMRALLTALGIIVGVGAFVTMVALGRGASARVKAAVEAMGANVLHVSAGTRSMNGSRSGAGATTSLTEADAAAILREVRGIVHVAPEVESDEQVAWRGQNWRTEVKGTTAAYLTVRSWRVERGNVFDERDLALGHKVCVLGKVVVEQVFGKEDPLGQSLRVGRLDCKVIGVLARRGASISGRDYDDVVLMPITTVRRKLSNLGAAQSDAVERIYMSAASPEDARRAEAAVVALMRQRKNTREGEENDPQVRNLSAAAAVAQETNATMTMLLAGIASVSLVVGGIGIMNIMLVSVTERTREIGIRLAVGAKARFILLQFLFEAVVLTVGGGLVGMALGTAAAQIVTRTAGWPTELGATSYAVGFLFSMGVGVVFGFYPALRAALMDPIQALTD